MRDCLTSLWMPALVAALLATAGGAATAEEDRRVQADADAAAADSPSAQPAEAPPAPAEEQESEAGKEQHGQEGDAKEKDHAGKTGSQEEHGREKDGSQEHGPEEDGEDGHEAPHGAHHDPYDLSHQNAGKQLNSPSEFKSDLAIWTFVVFLLLLALLRRFAWGPIVDGLDRREAGIAARIKEAQANAEKAAAQLAQYEAQLAAAAEEARELMAQARKDAEAARERVVSEAQQAAQRERERAVEDITAAKNAALQDITEHSVDLAVVMAGRLMDRNMTADDRSNLIREALEQLPSRN